MEYSLLISTRNRKTLLGNAIDSVLRQTFKPKEYIIIDSKSTDSTLQLLLDYKKKYPNFRIFQVEDIGYCAKINKGIALATSPLVLIMDDDARLLDENWVKIAIRNMRSNVGIVWGNPSGFLNFTNYWESFLGCVYLIRKDIFKEVGQYDERFFIFENEGDLSIRIHRKGYRIHPLKNHGVSHPFKGKNKTARYFEYALSNRLFMYWKYYPFWIAIGLTPFRLLRELQAILYSLKDYSLIKYWFKGLKRFLSNFYSIGFRSRQRMHLKEFITHAYQLRFPTICYKLIKLLYNI
ncbi:MAG: glycosyltransferase family 2 protein [Candidatus Helarchaeota archaeon]